MDPKIVNQGTSLDCSPLALACLKGSLLALTMGLLSAAALGLDLSVPHAYWNLSRAGGIVAYLLLWSSVVAGLMLSTRLGRTLFAPKEVMDFHSYLSGTALAFCLFHALILWGDPYLSLGFTDLLIPFASGYKWVWLGFGQLALAATAAVSLTTHYRRRLGNRAWRAVHKAAFLAYWLGLAHAIALGSEMRVPVITLLFVLTGAVAFWLTAVRLLSSATPNQRPAR